MGSGGACSCRWVNETVAGIPSKDGNRFDMPPGVDKEDDPELDNFPQMPFKPWGGEQV